MTATPTRSGAQATATTTLTLQSFTSPVTIRQNVIRPSLQQPVFISIHLEKNEHVAVKIYNRQGQLIRTLYDQLADAGSFDLAWQGVNQNGNVVGSGIYFIDIKTDSFEEKRKVAVVK
jgi:flagellar hook assembly protein FlgD